MRAVFALGCALAASAAANQAPQLTTDFRNPWCVVTNGGIYSNYYGPDGVGAPFFGGSTKTTIVVAANGTAATNVYASSSGLRLDFAQYGQPVESQVAQFGIGDPIPPPAGLVATNCPFQGFEAVRVGNNPAAYYQSTNPVGGVFWIPSTRQLIAGAGGNVEVDWLTTGGVVRAVYTISSVPDERPSRVFWTEKPYNAPPVNLYANGQQIFACIHYNNYVTRPTIQTVSVQNVQGDWLTETQLVNGVWINGEGTGQQILATGVEGIALIEYYTDGTYTSSLDVQPIQVMPPTRQLVDADIGSRLLPTDHYYGVDDLIPTITAGLGSEPRVYVVDMEGPKNNWVFAIERTTGNPWDVEIYWEHRDDRGVVWPFEVCWYAQDWPVHAIRYVLGESPTNTAPAFLPAGLTASLPNQEPANVAAIAASGKTLSMTAPGYALVQYGSHDNVWFDVLRAVWHDDPAEFNHTAVPWPIGSELLPYSDDNYVLHFDGESEYVEATMDAAFHGEEGFTVEAWAKRTGRIADKDGPVASHTDSTTFENPDDWELGYGKGSGVFFTTDAGTVSWTLPDDGDLNGWRHLAGTYDGTNVALYVDGVRRASVAATNALGVANRPLWIGHSPHKNAFFLGQIDEVRLWNVARTEAEIAANMGRSIQACEDGLAACYPLDEGAGGYVRDVCDGSYGQIHGTPQWTASFHLANTNVADFAKFPGYLYSGTAYNVNRYDYPDEANPAQSSWLFPVNTNQFEVWWGRPGANTDMPTDVYYPSLVQVYDAFWPTNAPQIVIASGKGNGDAVLASPTIYYQNDRTRDGYNPNEEHALVMGGKVYALRDDLNRADTSLPFALVDCLDRETGTPLMATYEVVRTNAQYAFEYASTAGTAIHPPMPLGAMPACAKTSRAWGPAWADRKLTWWAKAGGNDGGTTNAGMKFFYQTQPSFWFPALATQPALGTEVPMLPTNHPPVAGGSQGGPLTMEYDIAWPEGVPEMKIAQTLTMATRGLPDVWNQLSVDVLYQQSATNGHGDSVALFDPVVEHAIALELSVVQALEAVDLARKDMTSSRYVLSGLPPALRERMYYDPDRGSHGQLVLAGEYRTTLTGGGYLLPNLLDARDLDDALALAADLDATQRSAWQTAVQGLPRTPTPIHPNAPYAKAALCSALSAQSNAVGYVTLVFNNSTNAQQVPPALPVSLSILKVVPELYNAFLDVVESDDALDEKLSLRYAADFAGRGADYAFEWRWEEPVGGLPPSSPYGEWNVYGGAEDQGELGITIAGSSPFTLADHYFAVRYRRHDGQGPTGTNWSEWSSNFAPGWIQRVMNGINPYEQRIHDMVGQSPNLMLSLIGIAGPPYEGAVALNSQAVNEAGLIQIYQTVMDRAISMSIEAGISDTGNNDALLFAASRLSDLYMLLGNEAYADAQDPTLGFGTDSTWYDHYGSAWSSLFCFMNQMPNLLEEELALLRGRDDTLQPSVQLTPVYNRLIWNFTRGINGGEVAYAMNYNVKGNPTGTVGTVTAEDAKAVFPQGHGDAWGHYCSALAGFYRLMDNANFGWNTTPGATLVGNAGVSSDFFDEQKFAEAAAAKARTGAEIVNRTFRRDYVEAEPGRRSFYGDARTNRAWGVDGWASRAGQGAYFDWVVANSLLLDDVTNLVQVGGADAPPEGIQKIDRTTVPELDEIAATLSAIQTQMDNADLGLSPLGLDRNAVPFDVSPAEIDEGQTHFDQIYERALAALNNAVAAFDYVQGVTMRMREQAESAAAFAAAASESELGYGGRLLEIYGYPYPDDVGPGKTYPQGYQGPDLVNYQILDMDNLLGLTPTGQATVATMVSEVEFIVTNKIHYTTNYTYDQSGYRYTNVESTVETDYSYVVAHETNVTFYVSDKGLKVKPPGWTGRRPAQGEIQFALGDFVKSYYGFLKARDEYNNKMAELELAYDKFVATVDLLNDEWDDEADIRYKKTAINNELIVLQLLSEAAEITAEMIKGAAEGFAVGLPKAVVTVFGGIETSVAEAAVDGSAATAWGISMLAAHGIKYAGEATKTALENEILNLELNTKTNRIAYEIYWSTKELEEKFREQYVARDELLTQMQDALNAQQRAVAVIAKGERLVSERARDRARAAQRLQGDRYTDMAFRIFRDEALSRYGAVFELAARYCYLAAKAYDYETGLLAGDVQHSPGSRFLSQIVKSRSLGRVQDGTPLTAGIQGDPGLADAMARMKADWDVVKGRMGFNNPDGETSRFSLRTEHFRVAPATTSDETWRHVLEQSRVDNLYDLPEFQEYCIPFSSTTNREPAIVIPFTSWIVPGLNFFGRALAGGDNAYDPTHAATKIRSLGVWFTGFNVTFNTNLYTGGGLANQPRVYLVPVGSDVMRSPTRNAGELRSWRVFDQALPLPFDVGRAELDQPDWIPLFDSLSDSFAQRRRHAALRAYHDRGQFDAAETISNSRLVGRSVWNTRWLLIIPGRTLLSDADEAIERFIYGAKNADGTRDGNGVKDVKLYFQTYSIPGE
jgi:hypothetical protein